MKYLDVLAAVLLVIGGLNWGLIGMLDHNLVSQLFGANSPVASLIYSLVGISALYQALALGAIQERWGVK